MVLMLFTVGRYLEAAGRARAARDLEPLLAAESECATVVNDGTEIRCPVREVRARMQVRVRPGERIPVDGVVTEGESHTDEAVITGESRQVAKGVGSPVIAGSIDGPLLIQSSGAGTATRWAQICRSVRDALVRRSPTQRIADRVVGASVPLVLALGGLTMLYWAQWLPLDRALLFGLAVLVVACPCAVGLAAPLATSLGIGRLARCGCLVRDPGVLEALARTRLLAFDKTGTLTSGRAHVVGIESDGAGTDEVLARAAGLERHSEHGLARAITVAAATRGLEPVVARDVRSVPAAASGEGRWASGGGWERRFDERTGLVTCAGPQRAWAVVGGERLFGDLCRLGRAGSRRAVARQFAASRSAPGDRCATQPRAAPDTADRRALRPRALRRLARPRALRRLSIAPSSRTTRVLDALGDARGQGAERRQARGLADRTAHHIRSRDQPQDRQGSRPYLPANSPRPRQRGHRMKRRAFIAALGGAAAWPFVVCGQGAVAKIGFLSFASAELPPEHGLLQGLLELGWVEGQNILIERRYAAGDIGRLNQLAAELVQSKVALIVGFATSGTLAAKNATASIPIVMVATGDPVGQGFVENLARPGGNITGLSFDVGPEITAKQVQLLKEAVPKASRLAVLWNPTSLFLHSYLDAIQVEAKGLGVSTQSLEVKDINDIKSAFEAMKREQADVLIVLSDGFAVFHRRLIADLAAQQQLPAIYGWRIYMDAGALMSYGPSISDLFHGAARYVDKIIKGAKPADLPVEQPTKFELIINLKTAKALGLEIPSSLLARADEVIE